MLCIILIHMNSVWVEMTSKGINNYALQEKQCNKQVFICSLQMSYSIGEPLLETMVRSKKQLTLMTQKVKEHLKEAH